MLGLLHEHHGRLSEHVLVLVDGRAVEVRRDLLGARGQEPLGGVGVAKVDDVHDLPRLHRLQDGLVRSGAGEAQQLARGRGSAGSCAELAALGPTAGQGQRPDEAR